MLNVSETIDNRVIPALNKVGAVLRNIPKISITRKTFSKDEFDNYHIEGSNKNRLCLQVEKEIGDGYVTLHKGIGFSKKSGLYKAKNNGLEAIDAPIGFPQEIKEGHELYKTINQILDLYK